MEFICAEMFPYLHSCTRFVPIRRQYVDTHPQSTFQSLQDTKQPFETAINLAHYSNLLLCSLKCIIMESVMKWLGVSEAESFEKFRMHTSILLVLFFLVFGTASMLLLLNSAA